MPLELCNRRLETGELILQMQHYHAAGEAEHPGSSASLLNPNRLQSDQSGDQIAGLFKQKPSSWD